jgi:hypothetical protein
MKIRPVGTELFHSDRHGRTDRHDEAHSRFSQFYERAYNTKQNVLLCFHGKGFKILFLTATYLGLPYKRNKLLSFHCNKRPIWLNNKIKYCIFQ